MANKTDNSPEDNADTGTAVARKMTRDELRAVMFSPEKTLAHRIPLMFNGVQLEWQRPSIQELAEAQDASKDRNFMVGMIINYSYLPNTDEKVFEDSDYAVIMKMPYTDEYGDAVQTIVKALNMKVDEKVKN